MAAAASAWFVAGGLVTRMDVRDGVERWSQPRDLVSHFPALAQLGVTGDGGTAIVGAFQTGSTELVFVTGMDVGPVPAQGCLRVNLALGVVTEGPTPLTTWFSTRVGRQPNLVAGLGDPRRVLFMYSDEFAFFDPVADTMDGPHPSSDLEFARPDGPPISMTLGTAAVHLPDGRLYVFDQFYGCTAYDLQNRTSEIRALADAFPQLSATPSAAWSMSTVVDDWAAVLPTGDVPTAVLRAIRTAATGAGLHPNVVLAVVEAESGGRIDAYHPAGRYGLLQLTAERLAAAGWAGPPAAVLTAPPDAQQAVLQTHLGAAAVPPDADEAYLWGALLTPGDDRSGWAPETVIAAPDGPRPELLASHGVADVDGDGRLTLGDLDRHLRQRREERRMQELLRRLAELD
jgi:hypothetical protein